MIEDRNKSTLTKMITAACSFYLDEHGFKPVETEVPIARSWIADIAAAIEPTRSELVKLKLLKRRPGWRSPQFHEWQVSADAAAKFMVTIVEVKATKSDYMRDAERKFNAPPPANLNYVAMPADLIARVQLPAGWGVLAYGARLGTVRLAQPPCIHAISTEQQLGIVLRVAVRRDHFTRYQRIREFRREEVNWRAEQTSISRLSSVMAAVLDVVDGKRCVQEALEWHGIKHVAECQLERLRSLQPVREGGR